MMTAEQYRGKAREAARHAATAPDERIKAYWLGEAREWSSLAARAEEPRSFQPRRPER